MAEPTPQEFYAQVLEDAKGHEPSPYPGAFSRFVNHPGVLAHRTKTPEEYDQDQRFAYVLRRLEEQYPNSAYRVSKFPHLADFRSEDWDTPYQRVGVMGEGQPVPVGLNWLSLPASYVNNAGPKALANLADRAVSAAYGQESHPPYEAPLRQAGKDMNTFLLGYPQDITGIRFGEHDATKNMDLAENYQVLKDAGAPEWLALSAGSAFDAAADPFNPGGMFRAIKQPTAKALKSLAGDLLPEPVLRTIPPAVRYLRERQY